ncbi:DUF2577 family protein [Fusobacterium sp. IOR10]|uniref:DUF2577 family protein n=1 Tax=Fusobacterium sp. IOR10 TaxID=2665157 RepID=UPI0013D65748|nr:DUF2577 family protein [Fusobacterium sp. IOR10]
MKDNQIKMTKIFKERENISQDFPIVGKVISPPPGLRITISGGIITLEPNQLYINYRLMNDYTRAYKLSGSLDKIDINTTTSNQIAANHAHKHSKISGSGTYEASGTFINTDTLKNGDLVKLSPTYGQKYFIDYKIVKLGGEE